MEIFNLEREMHWLEADDEIRNEKYPALEVANGYLNYS